MRLALHPAVMSRRPHQSHPTPKLLFYHSLQGDDGGSGCFLRTGIGVLHEVCVPVDEELGFGCFWLPHFLHKLMIISPMCLDEQLLNPLHLIIGDCLHVDRICGPFLLQLFHMLNQYSYSFWALRMGLGRLMMVV